MSIIYDALKKAEKANPENSDKDNKKSKIQFKSIYLVYILMIFVGFFIAKLTFDTFLHKPEVKTKEITYYPSPEVPSLPVESKPAPELAPPSLLPPPKPLESQEVKEKLLSNLSLSGIFFDEEQPYAIINNRIVKEGDVIEGAKIVRILSSRVDLEFEGESIELRTTR